jgi:quercetin dioxygenase-like cupin family protein
VYNAGVMKGWLASPALAMALFVWSAPAQAAPDASASNPATSTPKPVEASGEPHHQLAFENKYVRTLKVQVAPKAATQRHLHNHDYFTVTFGDAELSNEVDGKAPATVKLQDGQVRFSDGRGPAHLVRNLGSAPFRNVTIELLQDEAARKTPPTGDQKAAPQGNQRAQWDKDSGSVTSDGGVQEILFVKDGVRVSKLTLQPGGTQPARQHTGPDLLVAVTDVDLGGQGQKKHTKSVQLKAGDVKWIDVGLAQTLNNSGKKETKAVLLEFM